MQPQLNTYINIVKYDRPVMVTHVQSRPEMSNVVTGKAVVKPRSNQYHRDSVAILHVAHGKLELGLR